MEPIEEFNHSTVLFEVEETQVIVDSDCKGNIHYPFARIDASRITQILQEIAVRTFGTIDEPIEDLNDGSYCTILNMGAYYNCEIIVEEALKKGANFTLTTYGVSYPFLPMTALALACDNFNISMAKLLIKYGADCSNIQVRVDDNGYEIRMLDCDYFSDSTDQKKEVIEFQQTRDRMWIQKIKTRLNEYR